MAVGRRLMLAAVLVSILSSASVGVARAAAPPATCAAASALAANGEASAAESMYVAVLKGTPASTCAAAGLTVLSAAATTSAEGALDAKCDEADRLRAAGQNDAAKAIYVEVLKAADLSCATSGLAALATPPSPGAPLAGAKDWLSAVTSALGLGAGFGLICLAALCVLFVILTWVGPVRWVLRHTWLIGRALKPRLSLGTFADPAADAAAAAGVAALVRAKLHELSVGPGGGRPGYSLDRVNGGEDLASTIGTLADLAPQFKQLGAILTATPQLARLPRFSIGGTLQAAGVNGEGIVLILEEQHGDQFATTLWSGAKASDDPNYQALAAGAAAWADLQVKRQARLPVGRLTSDPVSFGYLRLGAEFLAEARPGDAKPAFQRALQADAKNVGALLNLSIVEARASNFSGALDCLTRAREVIETLAP